MSTRITIVALCCALWLVPGSGKADAEDAGAALVLPYFTSFFGDYSVLTVTNVSAQPIALRVLAIDGDETLPTDFDAVSFACPLIAGQTTDLVIRPTLGVSELTAECATATATAGSPIADLSQVVTQMLLGTRGILWIAVEDRVTGATLGIEALQGRADVFRPFFGTMYTVPPFSISGGTNDGDREYRLDGVEYGLPPGLLALIFMAPTSASPPISTTFFASTVDGAVGAGEPGVAIHVDHWNGLEWKRNANYFWLGGTYVPFSTIDERLDRNSVFETTRGYLEAASAALGPGGEKRPFFAWIVNDYSAGGDVGAGVVSGLGSAARAFHPTGAPFVPEPGGDVTLLGAVDSDGDGVEDLIAVADLPGGFSDVISGGTTTGVVVANPEQLVRVIDAGPPDGVKVLAREAAAGLRAEVEVCDSIARMFLRTEDGAQATCGSAALRTLAGSPLFELLVGGIVYSASPAPEQGVVANGTIFAPADNTEPIPVDRGIHRYLLDPGITLDPGALAIDVVPFRKRNGFNNRSRIPIGVAVLGNADVDPTALDPATLRLGPDHAAPVRWRGKVVAFDVDVDDDGWDDLLVFFRPRDTGYPRGTQEVCLDGALDALSDFVGCEEVRVTGRK